MDTLNWLALELLAAERTRAQPAPTTRPRRAASSGGAKRALASAFVRLGLRLDPAAGEGLSAPALTLARPEGGRS